MAKATLQLPDGTSVVIEGTPNEVHRLLSLYGGESPAREPDSPSRPRGRKAAARKKATRNKVSRGSGSGSGDEPDLSEIVNLIKTCDEAEAMEKEIFDRTSQVNRILLSLYVVHEHLDNAFGLTSGEISKITTELGIPISQPNASSSLSGTASRYVVGSNVRRKGRAVRYKIHRRGVQYFKTVLAGEGNAK